jgi:hypothetical protein
MTLAADPRVFYDYSWDHTVASPPRIRDAALDGKDNHLVCRCRRMKASPVVEGRIDRPAGQDPAEVPLGGISRAEAARRPLYRGRCIGDEWADFLFDAREPAAGWRHVDNHPHAARQTSERNPAERCRSPVSSMRAGSSRRSATSDGQRARNPDHPSRLNSALQASSAAISASATCGHEAG